MQDRSDKKAVEGSRLLITARLYLRQMVKADYEYLVGLHQNPEVMRYIGAPRPREVVLKRIQDILQQYQSQPELGIWMACKKEDDERIGWACLKDLDGSEIIEVGYRLSPEAWGKGYATELARALVAYGFRQLDLASIAGVTLPENMASRAVLQKAGLRFLSVAHFYQSDLLYFEITKAEWQASEQAKLPEPS
ncbi:MAG: GNAT family N-acetyltransferase [Saprospiraceae bacterium]|nr:GNAT family N-acetyltransferase [Saprospiraceae bacterium]